MVTSLLALPFHLFNHLSQARKKPRGMPPTSMVAAYNPEFLVLIYVASAQEKSGRADIYFL